MIPQEEYAEWATKFEKDAVWFRRYGAPELEHEAASIGRVLRALADGAVLCEEVEPPRVPPFPPYYRALDPQP